MNINDVLPKFEAGKKFKRSDWGYPNNAYIQLLEFNHNYHFYMFNQYMGISHPIGYEMNYNDLKTDKWVEV